MKSVSVVLNLGLSAFTVFVLATDGMPTQAHFVALSLLLVLVPGLSALVIGRADSAASQPMGIGRPLAITFNIVLLGASFWAFVTQFPSHPSEPGLIPFVILTLGVPVVSLLVLWRDQRPFPGRHPVVG